MSEDNGRVPLEPGSHPTGHAACSVDGASRVDPSRIRKEMMRYYADAREAGWTPVAWHISVPLHKDMSNEEARLAQFMGLPVLVHDEWTWGWMMTAKPALYASDSSARFWEPFDRAAADHEPRQPLVMVDKDGWPIRDSSSSGNGAGS